MLIDTHAHLDFPQFSENVPYFLQRAHQVGVHRIITIGTDLSSSAKSIQLAEVHEEIHATVGVHPHDALSMDSSTLDHMKALSGKPKVVALGEMGLDFFRDRRPRPVQKECFKAQLEVASAVQLPVVFHIRDAFQEFFDVIASQGKSLKGGVLHCFSGDWPVARRCLDLGFYLSVPGVVTYPKAHDLQEVVRKAPLDRLLLETDAPYLTPVPHRGKVNEPSYVHHTAQKVAQLRKVSLEEVARGTTRNACSLFGLEIPSSC